MNFFDKINVLKMGGSWAWAGPARFGPGLSYSRWASLGFFNLGLLNKWAGLGLSGREPNTRPGPNIKIIIRKGERET